MTYEIRIWGLFSSQMVVQSLISVRWQLFDYQYQLLPKGIKISVIII